MDDTPPFPAAQERTARLRRRADLLFLLLVAVYAWAALQGIGPLSAGGAFLDSDLATYAQGMAGEDHPELFRLDPVLREATAANSIWNLERFAATRLAPGDDYALGLFRAGAICIFVFYAGFYLLGRWLFTSPVLAAMLALVAGVTVWIGWGTFWGVAHSDPVPRVFFAALWPFLLLAALKALTRPWLRPVTMLATGLCMWVHGISALAAGAMFFTAFALHRPPSRSLTAHLGNLVLCLACYFTPVLAFLWPSLSQKHAFSAAELNVFQELFARRWREDYGQLWTRLAWLVQWDNPALLLFCGGLAGWLITLRRGGERARRLAGMYPAFILALALVVLFSWAESLLSPHFGRLPLGHELVRGVRFLAPLSWLMLISGLACFWPRCNALIRGALFAATLLATFSLSQDRQHMAALYALTRQMPGLPLPLQETAQEGMRRAVVYREALDALQRLVPAGDAVFSDGEDMAVRYLALRGLVYTFKDGYVFFYNKDVQGCRDWLRYTAMKDRGPTGYVQAWLASGTPWLLSGRLQDRTELERYGNVLWENAGWLIVRRR